MFSFVHARKENKELQLMVETVAEREKSNASSLLVQNSDCRNLTQLHHSWGSDRSEAHINALEAGKQPDTPLTTTLSLQEQLQQARADAREARKRESFKS